MSEKKAYYQVSTLQRGLSVIELLAKSNGMTITALSRELGLNRSASHRFLATLEDMGYVGKTKNKRYYLTFKLLQIGMQVANSVPLRKVARPYLQMIADRFQENVNLGYWDGHRIVHLDKIESKQVLRIDPSIGSAAAGHCTAQGKAILAHLPEEELDSYLRSNELTTHTPETITTRRQLDKELAAIRQKGYAVDNQELSLGLRCVAAPVFDYTGHICCSLSVAALEVNMPDARIDEVQHELRRVCIELSLKLGAPPDSLLAKLNIFRA